MRPDSRAGSLVGALIRAAASPPSPLAILGYWLVGISGIYAPGPVVRALPPAGSEQPPAARLTVLPGGKATNLPAVRPPRRHSRSACISQRDALTVAEVASIMRLPKTTVYQLIHSGELEATRVGRSFRIPATKSRSTGARLVSMRCQ
jgi:excisionase family DNA binding protein